MPRSARAGIPLRAVVVLVAALAAVMAGVGWIRARAPDAPAPASEAQSVSRPAPDPVGQAPERPPALVYTGDACTLYCPMQIRDLEGLGIAWEERNVDRDEDALQALLDRDDEPVLPSISLAGSLWRGYDATHARAVLHKLRSLESLESLEDLEGAGAPDRLVVYTRSDCPFSAKLLADLDALGLHYDNRLVDLDAEALAELVRLMGQATVPVSVLGGEIWPGYAEEHAQQIREHLERG